MLTVVGAPHLPGAADTLDALEIGEGRAGELYLVDHDRTHQIYRLVRNPAATGRSGFPRRLSQTGLFASTRDHRPARGVIPYRVNAELWSDGATAERFLAVPGDGRIGFDDKPTTAMVRVDCRISGMVIEFQDAPEFFDLFRREQAITPGRQIELQETDFHAAQLLHQPPEVLEHFPDLILAAFRDFYLIPGIGARFDQLDLRRRRFAAM